MRLDKYIAACRACTRREAKELLKTGVVTVNGTVCPYGNEKINEADDIRQSGVPLIYREHLYLMLNKPAGYVSAVRDRRYPPVTDLIPPEFAHMKAYPAGRLDRNTEGLLLLTNDGEFAHRLTSPNKNVYKRYFARLDAPMQEEDKAAFAAGIELKDFRAKPARLEITDNPCEVYVEITEGKYHQVRRMCAKVGKNVLYLRRVAIGGLKLDENLEIGGMRELTDEELKKVFSS